MKKTLAFVVVLFAVMAAAFGSFAYEDSSRMFHFLGDPYPRIVTQAFAYIDKQYVAPERAKPEKLLSGSFKALETRFPPVIIDNDPVKKLALVKVATAEKQISTAEATDLEGVAKVLNEVLGFVAEKIEGVDKKEDVYYAALNGAVGELDPHSNAINPKQFKEFMIDTRGSFGGIGFVFGIRDGNMTILSPIEDTPASRAGLRSGDRILSINGEPTINMPTDVAASKMRGDPGTEVTITIMRDGWVEAKDFNFVREVIHVVSVESYVINGGGPAILYVKIKNFQKDTSEELKKAIANAEKNNKDLAGVVIDLRNNPGGLLDQAIELSDGFLDKGTIVSTKGREGESLSRNDATPGDQYTKKPLMILINQGSASASEIVSGALRSTRAVLIGNKTYGKGSVQKLFPLSDSGGLKLTVAQYLTANDVSIQSIGIQPDIMTYPASIKQKAIRIGPPIAHSDEKDLKNAFNEWGNSSEKPWREVQYLSTSAETGEEEDVEESHDAQKKPPKSFSELTLDEKLTRLKDDFPISMARRILGEIPASEREGADRKVILKYADKAVENLKEEQFKKISAELSKINIPWNSSTSAANPKLSVSVKTPQQFEPGKESTLQISVKNNGSEPVTKVWGRTESDNMLLKGLDFVYGKIEPGAEKTWTADIKTPNGSVARWDPLKITLNAGGKELGTMGDGAALVRSASKPNFAYSYSLRDSNPKNSKLNNNGKIDQGDNVELRLVLENTGKGKSQSTDVNIRGEGSEQLYLTAARARFTDLNPQEKREALMNFRVDKVGDDGYVNVVVTINDTDTGAFLEDTLKIKADAEYKTSERRQAPVVSVAKNPPLRTANEKIEISVSVEDDISVKEMFAYLEDKKIVYKRNTPGDKHLKATFVVPLKEGSNILSIAAGDDSNLIGRQTFVINRVKTGEEITLNR